MVNMNTKQHIELRVYQRRWLYMAVACIQQFTQMAFFLTYATVADATDLFYGENTTNVLSAVFMIGAIVATVPAMWICHRYGLASVMWIGNIGMVIGMGIRCFSNITSLTTEWRFWLTFVGPVGIMFMSIVAPITVPTGTGETTIPHLNYVALAPAVLAAIMCVLIVHENKPPYPPSQSEANQIVTPFWEGLASCFTSFPFWILFIAVGMGVGLFNTIYVMMEQLLCVHGYSDSFSGWCLVAMIVGGLIGATLVGIVADSTGYFNELLKLSFPLVIVATGLITLTSMYGNMQWPIAISCGIFGFFGLAAYAISFELAVECTYPVNETTSAGLIGFSGQIFGLALVILFGVLARPLDIPESQLEVCSLGGVTEPLDQTLGITVVTGIGAVVALLAIPLFSPDYRRAERERQMAIADAVRSNVQSGEQSYDNGVYVE